MIICDRTNSQRLLQDRLSEPEADEFVRHLDGCARCRSWLEEDAGGEPAWRETRDLLSASSDVVNFPTRVAGDAGLSTDFPATMAESAVCRSDLSFLAPVDDPAYVGRMGGYLVSGLLGRGGMGIVLKAVDSALNRNVAIKVLDPTLADLGAARQRFAREARAMAAISHEHVIPIFAVDEQQGVPFFAMEYVAGGTLEARLRKQGTLNVLSIVRISLQTARALAAAHDSGLVHRDIKPGNILLDQGTDRVRVADFGLARVSNDVSFTRSGIIAGTPQFMSPEQVRGEACDARSDLFSLGSMMYAMCTGHAPFRAETVYGAMHRIVHDAPRPIREQNAEVPEWLAGFVQRLLEKERERRFTNAHAVAEILEAELAALQNPALTSLPARPWLEASPTGVMGFSPRSLRLAGAGALVTAAAVWLALTGGGNEEAPPQLDAAKGNPPARPVEFEGPPPPLWTVDGFAAAQAEATRLEREFEQVPPAERWVEESTDIQQLRQRVLEVEQNGF